MGSVPGNNRRGAVQLDRKYGLGNFDQDWVAYENFERNLITGAVAAGSNQNFRVISQSANVCVTPSTFATVANSGNPGGHLITTSATANEDSAQIDAYAGSAFGGPFPPTLGTALLPQQTVFDTIVRLQQIVTCAVIAGLKLTTSGASSNIVGTDNDQALFCFDTTLLTLNPTNAPLSVNWLVVASVAGVDLFRDTGVPVLINKDYRLKIVIRNDGVPQFYINNGTPITIPGQGRLLATALLKSSIQITTRAAVASSMTVRAVRVQRRIPS